MKPLITGTLIVTGFLALVVWLDRRDERKKNDRESGGAETPPDRDPHLPAQVTHRLPSIKEQHRANREAHWERQINVERWALKLSAIALATAIISAGFLYAQLMDARTALALAQRAVVVPNDLSIAPATADGHTIVYSTVSETIVNAGNTSTRDLQVYTGMFWDDLTLYEKVPNLHRADPDITEIEIKSTVLPNKWILGPKEKITLPSYLIEEPWAAQMRANQLAIYVIGAAYYYDTVGGKARHKTKFCFKLSGFTGDPDNTGHWGTRVVMLGNIPVMSSRPCIHNNCTDEECGPEQPLTGDPNQTNLVFPHPNWAGPPQAPKPKPP